jgi:hypothetical protein
MRLIADTHVHIYPCYLLDSVFQHGIHNLTELGKSASRDPGEERIHLLCLTERHDCHYFRKLSAPDFVGHAHPFRVLQVSENALELESQEGERGFLVAGRQIVTAERLEVLALTVDIELPDGKPVVEVLRAVREAGGLPVLSWAPGKWWFDRGRVVRRLLEEGKPEDFLLGDTTLRPVIYPEPLLMRFARKKGFRILAGSDPLPFAGQEKLAGTYGVSFEGDFDPAHPVKSIRKILANPAQIFQRVGWRGGPFEVAGRLLGNHRAKGT